MLIIRTSILKQEKIINLQDYINKKNGDEQ